MNATYEINAGIDAEEEPDADDEEREEAEPDDRRQPAEREAERRAPAHLLSEVGVRDGAEAAGLREAGGHELDHERRDVPDEEHLQVVACDRPRPRIDPPNGLPELSVKPFGSAEISTTLTRICAGRTTKTTILYSVSALRR